MAHALVTSVRLVDGEGARARLGDRAHRGTPRMGPLCRPRRPHWHCHNAQGRLSSSPWTPTSQGLVDSTPGDLLTPRRSRGGNVSSGTPISRRVLHLWVSRRVGASRFVRGCGSSRVGGARLRDFDARRVREAGALARVGGFGWERAAASTQSVAPAAVIRRAGAG